ncbi:MAG: YicC family protein [Nitrospira sp.]|nr:YicC family protein [Nitrospira sp.]
MIRSMTGYGRKEAAWSGGTVVVEVRSVNNRFCEVSVRLPRGLTVLEDHLKGLAQKQCARGRVELTVSIPGGRETKRTLQVDRLLAKQYHGLLQQIQRELKLGGTIDVSLVAGMKDVLYVTEEPVDDSGLQTLIKKLAAGALADLDRMRRREGKALAAHLEALLRTLEQDRQAVAVRVPQAQQEHLARMRARVEKLLESGRADAGRLEQELAILADKSDISEEIARLDSHLAQFRQTLKVAAPAGKTLDFLTQEMGREINTMGSKANDSQLSQHVIRMKGGLEKIREQTQNVE